MNTCTASPAEQYALAYVEGTLSEPEAERFEEHYFACPACLAYLQTLQAVGGALARTPVAETPEPKRVLSWPTRSWAIGAAAAALLLLGFFSFRALTGRHAEQTASASPAAVPAPAPVPRPANPAPALIKPSALADLALPAFAAPNLRGAGEESHFETGMKAYAGGDCQTALKELSQIAADAAESRAALFYAAACQMHLGDYGAAAKGMREVANAGDSPQQEYALFFEAQLALERNDAAAAHRLLIRTIALRGDLENRARAQDRKVLDLIDAERRSSSEARSAQP